MLKSTSRTEPSPPPHTCDAAPIKSKVAPWLTASQGVDYHSMACTVYLSHHRGGHCCRTGHRTVIDTLYVIITAQVPLHLASLGGHVKRIVCRSYVHSTGWWNSTIRTLARYSTQVERNMLTGDLESSSDKCVGTATPSTQTSIHGAINGTPSLQQL